jgi:hypothetical protein
MIRREAKRRGEETQSEIDPADQQQTEGSMSLFHPTAGPTLHTMNPSAAANTNNNSNLRNTPSTNISHAAHSSSSSDQFTGSLLRTRQLLSAALDSSNNSLAKLNDSSNTLSHTNKELLTYKSNLNTGAKLISKQIQRERTDRILIMMAALFFLCCCLYILNKRLRLSSLINWWINSLLK